MIRKAFAVVTVSLVTIALFASHAPAQGNPKAGQAPDADHGDISNARQDTERQGHHERWRAFRQAYRETVNLSDEQRQQVAEIFRGHAQAIHTYGHEHAAEIRQNLSELRQAKRNGDEEAIQAAQAKLEEHKQFRETQKQSLLEQLDGVLDDQQMAQTTELLQQHWQQRQQRRQNRNQRRAQLAEALELTDEQRSESEAIMSAAREQAQAVEDREGRFQIMREAMQTVHSEVLTDEQRTQLQQLRRERSPLGRLGATDKQFEQAEAIIGEAREQARQAETREQRREIMRAARERIRGEVLTDQQRTQAQEMRRQDQKRQHGERGSGRGRRNNTSREER